MGKKHDKERDRLNGAAYYLVNKEKVLARQKRRYIRIKEQYLKHQAEYRNRPEIKIKHRIYQREYRLRKRRELVALLGNKCTKCGFSDLRAVEIDHLNGGGSADKRMVSPKSGVGPDRMYAYYVKRPELAKQTLQLLCRNCNKIKQLENHEQPYFGDVL